MQYSHIIAIRIRILHWISCAPEVRTDTAVFFRKRVLGGCSADHRVVEAGVAVVEVERVLA